MVDKSRSAVLWELLRQARNLAPPPISIPRVPRVAEELVAAIWEVDRICRACSTDNGTVLNTCHMNQSLIQAAAGLKSPLHDFFAWNDESTFLLDDAVFLRARVHDILGRPDWRGVAPINM